MLSHFIANTILHVVLISVFIGIFFFTYASKVEKEIVETRSIAIVQDLMKDYNALAPSSFTGKTISQNINTPDMSKDDAEVEYNNKLLIMKVIKVLSIGFTIGILVVISICIYFKIPLKPLIITNLVSLFFVALTEFSFLTFFAKNYITIDSNYVKKVAIKTLINYGNN